MKQELIDKKDAIFNKGNFAQVAINKIKESLEGLPIFPKLVIYELLAYCDFQTGIIVVPSMDKLAKADFFIEAAPGRKKEAITADTIRNALRTIKTAKPEQFKFSTINQRVIIEMPFLRCLSEKLQENDSGFGSNYPEKGESKLPVQESSISLNIQGNNFLSQAELTEDVDGGFSTEFTAASFLGDINNKIKNNNHNVRAREDACCSCLRPNSSVVDKPDFSQRLDFGPEHGWEQESVLPRLVAKPPPLANQGLGYIPAKYAPIADDFRPTAETVQKALDLGHEDAINLEEIQKFINYNKAIDSQWADYNPVYLKWLSRKKDIEQQGEIKRQAQIQKLKSSGSYSHEAARNKITSYKPSHKQTFEELMEAVRKANPNATAPSAPVPIIMQPQPSPSSFPIHEELFALPENDWENIDLCEQYAHRVVMGSVNCDLRPALY